MRLDSVCFKGWAEPNQAKLWTSRANSQSLSTLLALIITLWTPIGNWVSRFLNLTKSPYVSWYWWQHRLMKSSHINVPNLIVSLVDTGYNQLRWPAKLFCYRVNFINKFKSTFLFKSSEIHTIYRKMSKPHF